MAFAFMPDDPDDESKMQAGRGKAPPTSRIGRFFKLGALAPSAIPVAMEGARKALGMNRTEEQQQAARERTMVEAKKVAEQLLKTLGEMKGLPLKLGQMVSYIDGLAPPGYEDRFQAALKKLQQKAPPLDPEAARRVVKEELGDFPEVIFAEWEREPFAAASIGQVHRATTHAGERVAVKVQYPGIDKAIKNDLKSLSMLEQFASPIGRKYHTKETTQEIADVFLAELDYTREAEMADLFRRMNADLEGVVIPKVHHSLSTKRVLTTELLGGMTYAEICERGDKETRDKAGSTIWTFMFRSMLRYGALYADPHPGNYRFFEDGKVGFLDFGCVKMLPKELTHGMKRYMSAAMDADWKEFDKACVEVLGYDPSDKAGWDLFRSYTIELLTPLISHTAFECSPEAARETVAYLVRGMKKIAWSEGSGALPNIPKPIHMPPDFTFVNRLQWGLASVMGGLRTEAKFRALTEPWIRDGEWPLPS